MLSSVRVFAPASASNLGPGFDVLGLVLGIMVRRGRSLWIPIAAHVTFDFVQVAIVAIAPKERVAADGPD